MKGQIQGWYRKLKDERLEIFLHVSGVEGVETRRIRASGPEREIFELVDWFEEKTGLRVESPKWRGVRSGPRPIEGQMTLVPAEISGSVEEIADDIAADGIALDHPGELSSHDATLSPDG